MNSLSLTVANEVATLVIEGGTTANAIDIAIIRSIHLALDQIQRSDSGVIAVVLTGRDNVFCSGVDLHSVDLSCTQARQLAHLEMRRFMGP